MQKERAETGRCREEENVQEINIEDVYDGIPVSVKGEVKACVYAIKEETADISEAGDSGGKYLGGRGQAGPSVVESLEVFSYEKKTAPLIKHIAQKVLETELAHLAEKGEKISLCLSVFSSKRYLQGAVCGLNSLLKHLSVPTQYCIEDSPCNGSNRMSIRSTGGAVIYSVWTKPFSD
ncbi:uncharacterized protein NEMAJ01_0102 [Nematocida major]|uniref:uncharacterized protein n=1 Tax=Nematocida major TaxID=1912982 RepID=UPI0020087197|nr:uncharacterized protein NEMAJ01_0102 [Nematocida major]KAH9385206.1 hypothetical protein NEMAJ01_0102 [Nematocida major]